MEALETHRHDGQRPGQGDVGLKDCNGSANGPARMLLRDLATGQLINLESRVRCTTAPSVADSNARLVRQVAALGAPRFARQAHHRPDPYSR